MQKEIINKEKENKNKTVTRKRAINLLETIVPESNKSCEENEHSNSKTISAALIKRKRKGKIKEKKKNNKHNGRQGHIYEYYVICNVYS